MKYANKKSDIDYYCSGMEFNGCDQLIIPIESGLACQLRHLKQATQCIYGFSSFIYIIPVLQHQPCFQRFLYTLIAMVFHIW